MTTKSSALRALRFEEQSAVLVLDGAVDCGSWQDLRTVCDQLVDAGISEIVWDLRDVTLLDDSALGVMVGCARRLDRCAGRMVIANACSAPRRMLAVTGLDQVLHVAG